MTDKLKPCPFCGGEADTEWHHGYWGVRCKSCYVEVTADGMNDAIEAWNKRSYIDEIVEQLEEEQYHCFVGSYEDYDPYEDGRFQTYEEVIALLKGVQNE